VGIYYVAQAHQQHAVKRVVASGSRLVCVEGDGTRASQEGLVEELLPVQGIAAEPQRQKRGAGCETEHDALPVRSERRSLISI